MGLNSIKKSKIEFFAYYKSSKVLIYFLQKFKTISWIELLQDPLLDCALLCWMLLLV